MFARIECLYGEWYMILISSCEDNRFHLLVGKHRIVLAIRDGWPVYLRYGLQEIFSTFTDSVEFGVTGLASGVKMRTLCDWASTQHADT